MHKFIRTEGIKTRDINQFSTRSALEISTDDPYPAPLSPDKLAEKHKSAVCFFKHSKSSESLESMVVTNNSGPSSRTASPAGI